MTTLHFVRLTFFILKVQSISRHKMCCLCKGMNLKRSTMGLNEFRKLQRTALWVRRKDRTGFDFLFACGLWMPFQNIRKLIRYQLCCYRINKILLNFKIYCDVGFSYWHSIIILSILAPYRGSGFALHKTKWIHTKAKLLLLSDYQYRNKKSFSFKRYSSSKLHMLYYFLPLLWCYLVTIATIVFSMNFYFFFGATSIIWSF